MQIFLVVLAPFLLDLWIDPDRYQTVFRCLHRRVYQQTKILYTIPEILKNRKLSVKKPSEKSQKNPFKFQNSH